MNTRFNARIFYLNHFYYLFSIRIRIVFLSLFSSRTITEELAQLQQLDLSNNNIWLLPEAIICPLQSLHLLNLTNNKIHDIIGFHFSASPSTRASRKCGTTLGTLDLSANNIDTLPAAIFSGLGRLERLQLNANKMNYIADRALEGLLSLSILDLSENRLSSLPPELFNEARNIQQLLLQNNSINVLAPGLLIELAQLQRLDLSHNELTAEWINAGTFRRLTRLRHLDVSFNRLDRLESGLFTDTRHLETLRLQENRIDHLGRVLFGLNELKSLALSSNHLHTIGAQSLGGLTALQVLSLDYNRISRIDPNALVNCTQLLELHLNGNKLGAAPEALRIVPQLQFLDLGENLIVDLANASFSNMTELYGLRLTENRIQLINGGVFGHMRSLQILNLSGNRIKRIAGNSFENNTHLQAIRLDGNLLHDISGLFVDLPNLVWLNISANQMVAFDYVHIPHGLKELDIHANRIAELGNHFEIESQLSLSILDASGNRLTEITGSALPNSIEVVNLRDNLIGKVQSYTFFKKPNIARVDLFGNQITTLDPNALRISTVQEGRSLPEFYIGGNPFECDCNLDWLQKNRSETTRTQPRLMDVSSIFCKLLYNRGKSYVPLVEAQPNQFLCQYDSQCTKLCHCCDFFACDCKMECPAGCRCFHDQSWTSNVVDCSRASYSGRLPEQIPMDSTQIYLDGNNFTTGINSHAFIGRRKLRSLFLNGSAIEQLQNRTFNGLAGLKLLHLAQNRLTELFAYEFIGLTSLTELYLQQNQLHTIANGTFAWLTQLQHLRLDGNRLLTLHLWSLPTAALIDLRLAENRWSCDCRMAEYVADFMMQVDFVRDRQRVRCFGTDSIDGGGFSLFLNETMAIQKLCLNVSSISKAAAVAGIGGAANQHNETIVLLNQLTADHISLLIGTLAAVLCTIGVSVLLCLFLQDVRVWLHSNCAIRLFHKNLDKDKNEREKMFDAFVSYSSKDEAFVVEQLAGILESSDQRYTLCLHYRDISPPAATVAVGSYLSDNIAQAIESSRRTIIVLSENFIKSEWCRFEFKSAHHQVLRDRRRRLIIVQLGNVRSQDLDPDLRLYMKATTRLKWGEPSFWPRLRYALPDVASTSSMCIVSQPTTSSLSPPPQSIAAVSALAARSRLCHQSIMCGNASSNPQQIPLTPMPAAPQPVTSTATSSDSS